MHAGKDHELRKPLPAAFSPIFEKAGVDAIITNAGGCGSHLRSSRRFDKLKTSPNSWWSSARAPPATPLANASHTTTPAICNMHRKSAPNRANFWPRIPGLTVAEIAESSALCCGSAGIYNLVQP